MPVALRPSCEGEIFCNCNFSANFTSKIELGNPRFQPSFLVYLQCRNQSRRNLHAERRTAELFMLNLLNLLSNLRQDLQSSDFKLLRQWNRLGTWEVNYPYLKRNMGPFSGQILFAATDLEARPEATSKLVWKKTWKLKVGIFSERCKYPGSQCLWMGGTSQCIYPASILYVYWI